jgi:predicted RNase H-like nuclease (RuvC/YqgF family)
MRGFFLQLAVIALLIIPGGCATSVDMDAMNRRIDDNTARLNTLDKTDVQRSREAEEALQALQKEVDALRKELADSRWTVDNLTEKVESFAAYREEVEQFITQFRKKSGEIDRSLEDMTTRLEADVRSLAEKLKKMLEEEPQ